MGMNFDRWTVLKLFEVILVLICLVFKRVTDDEASRVFLYLQRISREWSLLNNITWSRVGAALADATFGGYLVITFALFIGRLFGELPTRRRISEYIFLGIGAILFIVLGSLSYAALDSVPQDLVDNAAVVGTVSLITAGFFLLDMAGPKAKKKEDPRPREEPKWRRVVAKPADESKSISQQVYDIEKQLEKVERKRMETFDKPAKQENGVKNGVVKERVENGRENERTNNGYKQMREDFPRKYSIYGKDTVDGNETDDTEELRMPPRMEPHSPVWSNIRKGHEKYSIVSSPLVLSSKDMDDMRPPSRPGDPGYVQYTAQHWGEAETKTPRHSPTEV